MARQNKKGGIALITIGLAIVLLVFNVGWLNQRNEDRRTNPAPFEAPEQHKSHSTKKPKVLRELDTFTGKVIGIKDGDTFEVLYDSVPERVRLAEIDCPEKKQAFGMKAKQYASDLCFGKTVTVVNTGRDRYGRIVGKITTQEGTNVNEQMIKAGFAWHYKQYSDNAKLDDYEAQAREKHLGLWADDNPTPPWDYRKERRRK